jgi:hypothetical protein
MMREYFLFKDHMKRWESVAIVEQLLIKYCISLKEARRTDTKRERERERERECVCVLGSSESTTRDLILGDLEQYYEE